MTLVRRRLGKTLTVSLAASLAALTLSAGVMAVSTTAADAQEWRGRSHGGGFRPGPAYGGWRAGAWNGGWRGPGAGPVIAGAIGGLALGALAANAANPYGGPRHGGYGAGYGAYGGGYGAYGAGYGGDALAYEVDEAPTCVVRQRVYDQWGNYAGTRRVRAPC